MSAVAKLEGRGFSWAGVRGVRRASVAQKLEPGSATCPRQRHTVAHPLPPVGVPERGAPRTNARHILELGSRSRSHPPADRLKTPAFRRYSELGICMTSELSRAAQFRATDGAREQVGPTSPLPTRPSRGYADRVKT